MKVCVIGGAGYIGSHAVYELIRDNNEVVVIDNLSTGYLEFVHEKAKFYQVDITNKKDLKEVFEKEKPFDVVMHFAAKLIVPESMSKPLEYYYNNVEGVRIMLEVMTECNIKNVVFSSTAAVYGEPTNSVCHEEDPTIPINPYGESKLACERLIKWVCKAYGMNYCIFRYFNVAGADDSLKIGLKGKSLTHLVPIANEAALGLRENIKIFGTDYDTRDGTCIRDYIHVTDLAKAHILGAKYIMNNNESILVNLGSNNGYSVKEIVDVVNSIKPLKYEVIGRREGDPGCLIASNDKAKEILNWNPEHDIEDIVKSDMNYRETLI